MSAESRKEAHDYGERIRERLAERLQAALDKAELTAYGLEEKCGITRAMIGRVLKGQSKAVSLVVMAQMSFGLGLTFEEFAHMLEDHPHE